MENRPSPGKQILIVDDSVEYLNFMQLLLRAEGFNAEVAASVAAMEQHGWRSLDDFRGIRRDRIVAHSKIRRPDAKAYYGGYDAEGYAAAEQPAGGTER